MAFQIPVPTERKVVSKPNVGDYLLKAGEMSRREEDRRMMRDRFKMEQQQFTTSQAAAQEQLKLLKTQNEVQGVQLTDLKNKFLAQKTYNLADNFTASDFNYNEFSRLINDQDFQKISGITNTRRADMRNPQDAHMIGTKLKSFGVDKQYYEENQDKFAVVGRKLPDGSVREELLYTPNLLVKMGYHTYANEQNRKKMMNAYEGIFQQSKLKEQQAKAITAQAEAAAAPQAIQLDMQKTIAETAKAVAEGKLKQQEIDDVVNWLSMPENHGKAVADYETEKKLKPKEVQAKEENKLVKDINANPEEFFNKLDEGYTAVINNTPIRQAAQVMQGSSKLGEVQQQTIDGLTTASGAFNDLHKKVEDYVGDWNVIDNFEKRFLSVLDTDWADVDPDTRREAVEKWEIEGELGIAIASFIKAMSGAAVTDSERAMYTDVITKGKWSSREAALSSMKGAIEGLNNSVRKSADGFKRRLPLTYLDTMEVLKGLSTPESIGATLTEDYTIGTTFDPNTQEIVAGTQLPTGDGSVTVTDVTDGMVTIDFGNGDIETYTLDEVKGAFK